MAPGGVPVKRENRPPSERAKMALLTKAGAKVLLFFDMCKFFSDFFIKTCIFGMFFVVLISFSEVLCAIICISCCFDDYILLLAPE